MIDDPWKEITPPNETDAINARRVDADIPWGFFWARGVDRKCMLVLQHAADSTPQSHLPKLKGIDVAFSEINRSGNRMLVLKLMDSVHRDIFYRLCNDIVTSVSGAASEREVVEVSIARTWRWHHLLRGGSDGRLTAEEQKGLIGELLVMERYLLSRISAIDVVSSWRGPLGAPKDFEIGRVCIEAKARRGAAKPYIAINSEYQLDDSGSDALFLYIVELDKAPSDKDEGFTVSELATLVKSQIETVDNAAINTYEELLSATGFRWEDVYSDFRWIEGSSNLYLVSGDFPRIIAQTVMHGVSDVKYSISIIDCEPFIAEDGALDAAFGGGKHDN